MQATSEATGLYGLMAEFDSAQAVVDAARRTSTEGFTKVEAYTPVPVEERQASMKIVLWECLVGLVPVTVLTVLTLGAILAGLTTAAEAAGLGALGAIVLAICYGKFTLKGLFSACNLTMASTAMVLFLAVASNVFGSVFAWLGTANWITKMLLAAPLPAWGTMTLLLAFIFLLGWPFEWPAIVLIFMPLLAPVAKGLGYDMVWFATVTAVVLQTAFLSPPVAMAAFYLKGVAPSRDRRARVHARRGSV